MVTTEQIETDSGIIEDPIRKLDRDLKAAARLLSPDQVRFFVDIYYESQDFRIAAAHMERNNKEGEEPNQMLEWALGTFKRFEAMIRSAMLAYASSKRPGRWALSQVGIGPVLSAGLLAHIDINRAKTAGAIWRLSGLDPKLQWITRDEAVQMLKDVKEEHKGLDLEDCLRIILEKLGLRQESWMRLCQKKTGGYSKDSVLKGLCRRPYNNRLKVLAWKIGQSFMKQQGREGCYYGQLYAKRKALEIMRNERGDFKGRTVVTKSRGEEVVEQLPAFMIDARARRYAVKIFLSHLHHVMWESEFGTQPPVPYVLAHKEHTEYMPPNGWPCD